MSTAIFVTFNNYGWSIRLSNRAKFQPAGSLLLSFTSFSQTAAKEPSKGLLWISLKKNLKTTGELVLGNYISTTGL
ncbi:MAG: hypothetical protein JWN56_1520 [Sphingobacteriales bacterium]|nr:hypothetical protein [Sphingobacteriales bacterium]